MESRGLFIQMVRHIMDLLIKQRIPTELNSPGTDNTSLGYRVNSIGDIGFDGFGNISNSYG